MLAKRNIMQKVCLIKIKEMQENKYEFASQNEVLQATQRAIKKYHPVLKALS